MIAIAAVGSLVMYGLLYVILVKPFIWVIERWAQLVIVGEENLPTTYHTHTYLHRVFLLNPGGRFLTAGGQFPPLSYKGGCLLTSPEEDFDRIQNMAHYHPPGEAADTASIGSSPRFKITKVSV